MWGRMIIRPHKVSVLFNEPKLPKSRQGRIIIRPPQSFSTLQRAEIAEIARAALDYGALEEFQYSSTSRNC